MWTNDPESILPWNDSTPPVLDRLVKECKLKEAVWTVEEDGFELTGRHGEILLVLMTFTDSARGAPIGKILFGTSLLPWSRLKDNPYVHRTVLASRLERNVAECRKWTAVSDPTLEIITPVSTTELLARTHEGKLRRFRAWLMSIKDEILKKAEQGETEARVAFNAVIQSIPPSVVQAQVLRIVDNPSFYTISVIEDHVVISWASSYSTHGPAPPEEDA